MIIDNILEFVGGTPLIKVKNNKMGAANVYVKLEEYNPGGSIKTRIAFQMILDAEKKGILERNSGQVIIEPTGGNTGIGLAIAGAALGYNVVLVTPDNYSEEKKDVLKAFGAKVILSDHTKGNDSHVQKTNEIVDENSNYIYLNQFNNISNPEAHYFQTGEEIISDFVQYQNVVDAFVAGIGSGGTLMGVGKKLRTSFSEMNIVGVQPTGCDTLNEEFIPHKIQGIGAVLTSFVDTKQIDKMVSISYEEALYWMRYMAREMGVLIGISAGANIAASMKLAEEMGGNQNIVTVAPDSGRSYIDLFITDNHFEKEKSTSIV
ncbi:PLP-dependent cysteine synthase family protein [Pontibacillus litoralis]|uniref:Tryptophan synthase beta chain-like PALP domain-containing protein n=1 Tax=Pontibacillus litoralis JSM 072002 TaxID=1385512 RepID=A0A0A5HKS8_9BACI|nr:cysteine synthase family protein [Pontibacillus litoralis]KGX84247.1 hypothetical protein N784_14480 [Pontibacillus litoralis JSM 072002]